MHRTLDFLFGSQHVDAFFKNTWNKKSLFLKGEHAGKFAPLHDSNWRKGNHFESLLAASIDENGMQVERSIESNQIEQLFLQGNTICADVSKSPTLNPFLQAFGTELQSAGGPCFAKLYASTNDKGFAIHTDQFHVFVLQVEGRKRWYFESNPSVPLAISGGHLNAQGVPTFSGAQAGMPMGVSVPSLESMESVVLEPGDLLYLPPGTWHVARALEHSVAISISPPRLTVGQLMLRTIEEALLQLPEWREDMLSVLDNPKVGRVGISIEQMMANRLGSLRKHLDAIDARVFHRAWKLNVRPSESRVQLIPVPEMKLTTQLSHRTSGGSLSYLIAPGISGELELFLYHSGAEWSLPVEAEKFIQRMLIYETFTIESAIAFDSTISPEEVMDILSQLVSVQILKLDC
jgi:hypothetical protein